MKKEEKRELLFSAAKICFERKGFHGTNMREIAAEADVSLGSIYNYFKNKEDLIESFIERSTKELSEVYSSLEQSNNFRRDLKSFFKAYLFEMGNMSNFGIHLEILAESMRNRPIFKRLSDSTEEIDKGFMKLLVQQEKRGSIRFLLSSEETAVCILRLLEGLSLDLLLKKSTSQKKALKTMEKLTDVLILSK